MSDEVLEKLAFVDLGQWFPAFSVSWTLLTIWQKAVDALISQLKPCSGTCDLNGQKQFST